MNVRRLKMHGGVQKRWSICRGASDRGGRVDFVTISMQGAGFAVLPSRSRANSPGACSELLFLLTAIYDQGDIGCEYCRSTTKPSWA
jgi:hypothetical protein